MIAINTLLDVLKSLNSAQKPWQITLPILLGILLGLLPWVHPLHIVIFLLALLINMNFGLLVVTFGAVQLVAPLTDGLLHKIGYSLLTWETLKGFWTALYNLTPVKLLWFYNTINLGAMVSLFVLGLPLFFLGNFLVKKLQGVLTALSGLPVLGFFLARDEEEDGKAGRIFLVKRIIATIFIGVLFFGFGYFFLNGIVQRAMERGASRVGGTQVTIKSLSLNLPNGGTGENIQIADSHDPTRNLIQIEKASFRMDSLKLMERKVVVNEAGLWNMKFNTKRTSKAKKVSGASMDLGGMGTPDFNKAWKKLRDLPKKAHLDFLKKLSLSRDLKAFGKISLGQKEGEKLQKKWLAIQKEWEEKTRSYEKQLAKLRYRMNNLRAQDVKQLVRDGQQFIQNVRRDTKKLQNLDGEFKKDLEKIQNLQRDISSLALGDWKKMRDQYSPNAQGAIQLAKNLLGSDVIGHFRRVLQGYQRMMNFLGITEPKQRERQRGQWITFAENPPTPSVIVKKVHLSVDFGKMTIKGEGKDLSSDPELYGHPGQITLEGTSNAKKIRITALLDKKKGISQDSFQVEIRGLSFPELTTPVGVSLKNPQVDILARLKIKNNNQLRGKIAIVFSNVQFRRASKSDGLAKLIFNALESVHQFSIEVEIGGTLQKWKLSFSSNLDDRLTEGIRDQLLGRYTSFRKSLKKIFESTLSAEQGKLSGEINALKGVESQLQGQLQKYNQMNTSEFTLQNLMKKLSPIKIPKVPFKTPQNPFKVPKIKNPFK